MKERSAMEALNSLENVMAEWSRTAIVLRLLLATVLGIVIGIDRELKNRGAGVKTHVLVCLGSAIVMIVSEYVYHQFPGARADMNRNGAAVISGVGFLGVGTIIVTGKNEIRGLTTAAGLWASACAGLAAGIGFAWLAIVSLVFFVFTFKILNVIDGQIHHFATQYSLYVEFGCNSDIKKFMELLRQERIKFNNFCVSKGTLKGEGPVATVFIELPNWREHDAFVRKLQETEGIRYYEGI